MTEVGAFEAKNTLGNLLERVSKGEEITISRRGKPVARLVPVNARPDSQKARDAADALRTLSRELKSEGDVSLSDVLAWRDEGRA